MRRRSQHMESQVTSEIDQLVAENTYGGSKTGRPVKRQMPMITREMGITMEWDNRADKYPSVVRLRMTDNEWVEYHIAHRQPGFTEQNPESGNWKHGYPRDEI